MFQDRITSPPNEEFLKEYILKSNRFHASIDTLPLIFEFKKFQGVLDSLLYIESLLLIKTLFSHLILTSQLALKSLNDQPVKNRLFQ